MRYCVKLLLLLLFTGMQPLHAGEFVSLQENQSRVVLDQNIFFIEDATNELMFDDILEIEEERWQKNESGQANFGYSDSTYWLRVSLRNQDSVWIDRLLEIGYAVIDYLDVYVVRNGLFANRLILGDKQPFYERPIQNRHFLIPLEFTVNEQIDLFIKIKTESSVQAPMNLWDPVDFHQVDQSRIIFQGIYFGIALVMILYNLFVYLAVSEKTYLYYVAYITSMPLFLASLNGLSFQYFWPTATWWNDQSIVFFLNSVIGFGILFSIRFLSLRKETHYWINRYLNVIAAIAFVLMASSLLLGYHLLIQVTIYIAVLACFTLLLISIYRWAQGDVSARYFTVAWTLMLSGGIVLALNKFTVLPQNAITDSVTQIGSALEIILLSIALADRLNQEKRKAFTAQIEVLEHEREARHAQEEILKVQREANVLLEQRVVERTSELEKLNTQLLELSSKDALTGLKNRGFFDEQFQHYHTSAYRLQQPLSLLVIDIDHFKAFNDNYGHLVGDECLVMVSDVIKGIVSKPQDICCRYGGEEFVILLPNTDHDGAIRVAEKIRAHVAATDFQIAEEQLHITISIGLNTEIPTTPDNQKVMFDQADEALYRAKDNGRNRVESAQVNPESARLLNS